MSIQIIITDPQSSNKAELLAIASMLATMAGEPVGATIITEKFQVGNLSKTVTAQTPTIHADDNPAKGIEVPPASQVFATGGNPAEVFAEGADPATVFAGGTHGSAALDADAAKLNAMAGDGAAGPTLEQLAGNGQPAAVASSTDNAPPASVTSTSLPSGAAAPAAGLDLDTEGFPWDARIHAETRTKIKVGTWKVKRGVSDETLTAVRAELRAVLGNVAPPVAASPAVAAPPPPPNAGTVPPPPAVPNPPTGAVPPPPPPTEAPAMSFPQLCVRITGALGSGQLTQEALGTVLAANNLQGLPTLAAFPHLVPVVAKALGYV